MAHGNHSFYKAKLVYQSLSGISEDKMDSLHNISGLRWNFRLRSLLLAFMSRSGDQASKRNCDGSTSSP